MKSILLILIISGLPPLSPVLRAKEIDSGRLLAFWTGWNRVKDSEEKRYAYAKSFAGKTDVMIIDNMIADLRNQRDDSKFLAYLTVIVYFPPNEAKAELKKIIHQSRKSIDKEWANEFLSELK